MLPRALARAVSRMPSVVAACRIWFSAAVRVSVSRFGSAWTRRPVLRAKTFVFSATTRRASSLSFSISEPRTIVPGSRPIWAQTWAVTASLSPVRILS